MYLALFFLLCTPKTHTLAENPQDKQRAYADLLRPKSCTCLVDYLTSVFSPLYTLTNVHTHTHTQLYVCPPASAFFSLLKSDKQQSHAHIPILCNSLAGWPSSSEDRSETDRVGKKAAIHLLSACQAGQTSLGKQFLARESCKHHQPEWHNPSNYLIFLGYGLAPYWEAGCSPGIDTLSYTNPQVCRCHMGSQFFPWHLFLAKCCLSVCKALMCLTLLYPRVSRKPLSSTLLNEKKNSFSLIFWGSANFFAYLFFVLM